MRRDNMTEDMETAASSSSGNGAHADDQGLFLLHHRRQHTGGSHHSHTLAQGGHSHHHQQPSPKRSPTFVHNAMEISPGEAAEALSLLSEEARRVLSAYSDRRASQVFLMSKMGTEEMTFYPFQPKSGVIQSNGSTGDAAPSNSATDSAAATLNERDALRPSSYVSATDVASPSPIPDLNQNDHDDNMDEGSLRCTFPHATSDHSNASQQSSAVVAFASTSSNIMPTGSASLASSSSLANQSSQPSPVNMYMSRETSAAEGPVATKEGDLPVSRSAAQNASAQVASHTAFASQPKTEGDEPMHLLSAAQEVLDALEKRTLSLQSRIDSILANNGFQLQSTHADEPSMDPSHSSPSVSTPPSLLSSSSSCFPSSSAAPEPAPLQVSLAAAMSPAIASSSSSSSSSSSDTFSSSCIPPSLSSSSTLSSASLPPRSSSSSSFSPSPSTGPCASSLSASGFISNATYGVATGATEGAMMVLDADPIKHTADSQAPRICPHRSSAASSCSCDLTAKVLRKNLSRTLGQWIQESMDWPSPA